MRKIIRKLPIIGATLLLGACAISVSDRDAETKSEHELEQEPEHRWLSGNEYQRIDKVAEHLRGNDLVMWEVRYRHSELYAGIVSGNNQFAVYQLKKMETAMRKGMERRPKRAASYQWFFQTAIPPMQQALKDGDSLAAYKTFTAQCMACHSREKVEFMPVDTPWLSE